MMKLEQIGLTKDELQMNQAIEALALSPRK